MIIFNAEAILITLIAAILSLPFFGIYYYGGMSEQTLVICVSWMILVASLFGKFAKVVGRLFFIPMWILSIPLPFIITYATYGWNGIWATFGIFIGIIAFIVGIFYLLEKRRAAKLSLDHVEFPEREKNPIAYWEIVRASFFHPSLLKISNDIAKYNLRVSEKLERNDPDLTSLQTYMKEMRRAASGQHKVDSKVTDQLIQEIDQKIEDIKEATKLLEKVSP